MITRSHRFHGFNSLRHVYARGQTIRGALLATKYVLNDRRSTYRAAVVVSRKVHKSAVVRNRIRRRIYEIIRRNEATIERPYDIVILVFSDQVATSPDNALESLITKQLHKAGVLVPSKSKGTHAIVERKESL